MSVGQDPWDDPQARAWARDVESTMVPAMRDSACVAPMWTGKVDVKIAVEMGVAVLLDKPIILVVKSGVHVPAKLIAVADRIVESSGPGDPTVADRLTSALREVLGAGGRS